METNSSNGHSRSQEPVKGKEKIGSIPEEKVRRFSLEIGGKTPEQLISDLEKEHINIGPSEREILKSPEFTVLKKPKKLDLVILKLKDLFSEEELKKGLLPDEDIVPVVHPGVSLNKDLNNISYNFIIARANEVELGLCPAEVGPHLSLEYARNGDPESPFTIGMKPLKDNSGYPGVFEITRDRPNHEIWLSGDSIFYKTWTPDSSFVFSLKENV